MIVDCFMINNESSMLYYRLHLLGNIVDYFIVVESNFSHSGQQKPLFFQLNKDLFPFQDKIIHIVIDNLPFLLNPRRSHIWLNENYQRNMINKGIETINLNDNDILIISDLDEIPNPSIINDIKQNKIKINSIHSLLQDFYYYSLDHKINTQWDKSKILPYHQYKNQFDSKPQLCRNMFSCPSITNGGWHLSYFGDSEFIMKKLEYFAHQELNNEKIKNKEHIENCIQSGTDFTNRNTIEFSDKHDSILPPDFHLFTDLKHIFIT